jgi:hypothetical protein
VEQLEWDAPLVTEQPSPAALQVQRDASEQPILDRLDEAVASLESAMTSAFDADLDTDALAGIAAQIEGLHAQLQSALAELDH